MADLDVAVRLKFLTTGSEKLKTAARDLAAFGKASGKLSGVASGRFGAGMDKAWRASVKLGGALDKSAGAATRTAAGLDRIGREARDIDRARAAVERLAKANISLGMSAAGARARQAGVGASGAVAAGALGGAAARRRREARREFLTEAAGRISPEGYLIGAGGAVALGAAVGGAAAVGIGGAALATKEAIGREKAFANIQKKVTLDVGQSWDDLDRKVRKVSTTLGMAYEDAAAIFAQGGQGNIAARDLDAFAMLGAKVSTAWDIGAKEAAQMLTEVKAQTGKTMPELEAFADKINYLSDISAAAEKDVASMSQRALAGMQAAGVGEDQSLALMTGLRGVGMQDEVAARFLTAFTSKLRTATTQSKDAQAAFRELGVSAATIEKGMQTDALRTVLDLLDRMSKAKNPVGIAKAVGGGEWFDEILRLQQAAPEVVRLFDAIASGKWRGSTDNALKIDMGTTEAQLGRVKQSILDIMSELAKPAILPAVKATADWLESKATALRDAQQRSEESRAQVKPVGESAAAYEKRLGLDRGPARPRLPMIQQIEGAAPHIDVKQIDAAVADGVAKAGSLYDELQKLNVTVTPNVNGAAAIAQMDAVAAKARETANALSALSNFGMPSLKGQRVNPTITGAPRGGGATGPGAPAGPAPTTPGKQARRAGGNIYASAIHFHGVKDLAGAHRRLAALQNRAIRSARDGALHDVG